ncbi:hypothetical protein PIB30_066096 [Stylosanthes scabra]|uniref:Uncharacterized protein n=1 Tax=Stylosanthes scabra TaxID=79078 RepID=A0ABU6QP75_9FABA|nr:hypothetical protein [Stylosanthes scabra]
MPQVDGGNEEEEEQQLQQDQQPPQHGFPNFQPQYESQFHETLQGIKSHLSSMQFFQQTFYENMEKSQADYMEEVKQIKEKQRFHSQVWLETEKNMQLALERQGRDIVEMRKQLNLWTRNTSAREAYTCWAHQQANSNLEHPFPHKLILKSQFHYGLHLPLQVSVHHTLHLISHKVI